MKNLCKKMLFTFLNNCNLTKDELSQLKEWLVEYSALKNNSLPCTVEYVGGCDPDNEQNGFETISTIHFNKLNDGGGVPLLAHLGAKVLFTPICGSPDLKTVGDLKAAAKTVWRKARPMAQADWEKFSLHQKSYFDLNKVMKGLRNPVDLPDIRDHIYYLHSCEDDADMVTKIDIRTGEISTVPVSEVDILLCVAD